MSEQATQPLVVTPLASIKLSGREGSRVTGGNVLTARSQIEALPEGSFGHGQGQTGRASGARASW